LAPTFFTATFLCFGAAFLVTVGLAEGAVFLVVGLVTLVVLATAFILVTPVFFTAVGFAAVPAGFLVTFFTAVVFFIVVVLAFVAAPPALEGEDGFLAASFLGLAAAFFTSALTLNEPDAPDPLFCFRAPFSNPRFSAVFS